MKILVFGNYDGTNIGDDSILLHILNKFGKNAEIYIPSRHPSYIKAKYGVNSIRLFSFRFISEFLSCRSILIGGGGIFSKYIGPYAKLLPILAMIAKICGKKVFFYQVGVYNTAPRYVRELVKFSMFFSDYISVRDRVSLDTIGYVKKVKNVKVSYDPGLTLNPIEACKARELLRCEGVNDAEFLVGLSLKYTMDENINLKLVSTFSKFVDWIVETFGANVVFFPFSFNRFRIIENDVEIAKEIRNKLKSRSKGNFIIIKAPRYTPSEIKGMVGLMDVFIGMRFHSIVFAYSMNKRLVGISYEEKCEDFLKSKHLLSIDVRRINFDVLKRYFLAVMKVGENV